MKFEIQFQKFKSRISNPKIMNKNIQKIFLLGLMISSTAVYSQIKDEQLILNRKREPEVKKIEKKKTSVETVKNYPPEEKSANPVNYEINDVPAVSDFKTSTIQGSDISPKFDSEYQRNYLRFGMGNFGKILGDANISTTLENKLEIGGDVQFLSTTGLKKEYPWDSNASDMTLGAFVNSFGDKGKLNLNAEFGMKDYNYYGIYALQPQAGIDLQQKVNQVKVNGFYDFYSNEILNDVRVKTGFLTDHFDAKESRGELAMNLSKHGWELNDFTVNGDLGLGFGAQKTDFSLLNENSSNYFDGKISPKVTFFSGKSYLMIGSDFDFLTGKYSNLAAGEQKMDKTYWFPRAEFLYDYTEALKFFAGVDGGLHLNSYGKLLEENPYLVSDQVLKPTETKYHIYAGLKGDIDQNVKYSVSTGWAKVNDIMYFRANNIFDNILTLNRSAYNFANTFSTEYANGSVFDINGSIQYFPLENLALDANLDYKQYNIKNTWDIYNKPVVRADIGAKYSMLDKKLNLGFKGYFVSQRITNSFEITDAAAIPPAYTTTEVTDEKLPGYADINLSAEYKIHKNFSIFALGNNLLNSNYETFKGYKVLGAQIVGGVKVSF